MNQTADPEHIAISKSKGIKIDWKDGAKSDFSLTFLRERCPCASCTGAHGTPPERPQASLLQMYKPNLKILEIEPVGNYAIRIQWNDGHNTGIYTFHYLRELNSES